MRALSLAAFVVLAGCAEAVIPPGSAEEEWYLGGSWTSDYTQADIDAWCDVAKEYANECLVMESFPPQYGLRFGSAPTCAEARAKILQLEHIHARECSRIEPSPVPEEPTSSSPEPPAMWTLGGSFAEGYTAADIDAWCDIAKEYGNGCALMKSEPPQFSLRFASAAMCEEARARIAALPRLAPRECAPVEPEREPGPSRDFAVRTFRVTWSDGSDAARKHEQEWDVVRAWSQDGIVQLDVTTHGIEGGDFRFSLIFTPREAHGGVLFHRAGAAQAGTFDFRYTEAVFWSGREISEVVEVARESFVRIDAQDDEAGTLRGSFFLDFTGRCVECGERERLHRTVLEGSFGP